MQTTLIYSGTSVLVAAFQVVDALRLFWAKGQINQSFAAFASVEYGWAGLSLSGLLLALIVPRWLPISFIAYVVASLLYGAAIAALKRRSSESKFVVRRELIFAEGLFGLYFLVASLYMVVQSWPKPLSHAFN